MTPLDQSRIRTVIAWVAQLAAAAILAMSSFMKLSGQAEAIALFSTLGAEPWGRWAVGLLELAAAILLLPPRTAALGGVLGAVVGIGAIGTHLTRIGIAYNGDPSLFIMAIIVLLASLTTVSLRKGR